MKKLVHQTARFECEEEKWPVIGYWEDVVSIRARERVLEAPTKPLGRYARMRLGSGNYGSKARSERRTRPAGDVCERLRCFPWNASRLGYSGEVLLVCCATC